MVGVWYFYNPSAIGTVIRVYNEMGERRLEDDWERKINDK